MLEGRTQDLAGPLELIARAAGGRGGTWWIEGEPGIGKTALLDAVVAAAPSGCRVLRAAGRSAETELTWAGLGELIGPLVADGWANALPEVQRRALLGALSLTDPGEPVTPYAVCLGAGATIRAAAEAQPAVVVVDDVQWLDEPSRLVVEFLATRWAGDPVAMIVAGRPEVERASAVPVAILGPVDEPAAVRLLAAAGVHAPEVCLRLQRELGGNPLLLIEAARRLDAEQRTGTAPLPELLPVPASAMGLAERRLAAVGEQERTALLVAAIAPHGDLATVARALAVMGVPMAAVEQAEQEGLVEVGDGVIRFAHPTLRSAAYHGADAHTRRRAHRALADAVSDPVIGSWHRGLGQIEPDEAVAADLEEQSAVLLRRGAPLAAGRHRELAARLSPDPDDAARRLRLAAEGAVEHGADHVARALLDRAEAAGGDRREQWRRRRLRLRMDLGAGEVDESVAGLRALADEIAGEDLALAAEVLIDVMGPLVRRVRPVDLLAAASAAREWAEAAGDRRISRRADVALGVAQMVVGEHAEGGPRLARYREVLMEEGPSGAGVFLAEVVGPCLALFQRTAEVDRLFAELERDLRAQSAAPVLVSVLAARAMIAHGSSLPCAADLAGEAVDLAEAIGRPGLGVMAASSLVVATALIGDRERCIPAASGLLATGEPGLCQVALTGLGVLHLGHGELDAALEAYERLRDEIGIGVGVMRWEADWCEALVRARRPEEAERVVAAAVHADQALLAAGGFTRVRGMLCDDLDDAVGCFESAVAWFRMTGHRTGEGRTELLWGERLRRARRRAAAREHLERAVDLLEGVGACVWAERARRELSTAAGSRPGAADGVEALTDQELAIARLAAAGGTNQAIAEEVFLSPRTIESHLGAAFRKLGIRNRRQLSAMALDEPRLRP